MKVLSTEGLTKLIQLIKSSFISTSNTVTTNTVTLADVATSGDFDDLINKPTIPSAISDLTDNTSTNPIDKAESVADQRDSSSLKYWTGTRTQYDAIATKDSDTIYNITDDTDVTLPLLELLFPVGAVYFGTMSVCPLQTLGVGTWQALPQDKVIQIAGTRGSVGDTLNESLPQHTHSYTRYPQGTTWFNRYQTSGGSHIAEGVWSYQTVQSGNASSSTYQDNAPVQQDAYLLNGWRRIA